jgi:hypothetical protein
LHTDSTGKRWCITNRLSAEDRDDSDEHCRTTIATKFRNAWAVWDMVLGTTTRDWIKTMICQFSKTAAVVSILCTFAFMLGFESRIVRGAIVWDGEAGTQWWFNPVNWDRDGNTNTSLPPGNSTSGVTDTQINTNTSTLPGGEGVVFDPAHDPSFPPPGTITFPDTYSAQSLRELYISRQTTASQSLLTIKGDLTIQAGLQLGRSSNTTGLVATGRVNQLSGSVQIPNSTLDIAATDTSGSVTGSNYGNGIYDYRGGILDVSAISGTGIRLSPSSGTVGAAGIGRFIMHNPATPGYVRAYDYNAASGAGSTVRLADGINTGVGITEFHYENGGTRPIQVPQNLIINNGMITSGSGAGGVRSSRLQLVLDAAPTVDGSGVPQNLGLFDVAFSDPTGTNTSGAGDLGDFFSSADGATLYAQGAIVSATFGSSTYNWTISYTGNITWANADAGTVGTISDTGGVDVVLKGISSVIGHGVAGDYNGNGVVDMADYVLWRNGGPLQNEVNSIGTVDASDYTAWRSRFGNTSGAGSALASSQVPEPRWLSLAAVGLVGVALARRPRV